MQLLEQVWSRINSNGAIAYGKNDLIRAMEEGAIETLLVAIDLLRDEQTEIDGMLVQPLDTWVGRHWREPCSVFNRTRRWRATHGLRRRRGFCFVTKWCKT